MVRDHHARLALAAIEDARSPEGERLLRACMPLARTAAQHPAARFRSAGLDLLSMISALRGDRESALAHARSAKAAFDNTHHGGASRRVEYLLASLEGGRTGRERREAVHDASTAEGWRNPQRALAMYLPCLELIERG
jgi:Ni,Fe-hydrogenase I large subunit